MGSSRDRMQEVKVRSLVRPRTSCQIYGRDYRNVLPSYISLPALINRVTRWYQMGFGALLLHSK